MNESFKKVWVKVRAGDPLTIEWGKRIVDYLEKMERKVYVDPILAYAVKKKVLPESALHGVDLAIIIGGDGTLLRTVQRSSGALPPILGFTAGSLGFFFDNRAEEYVRVLENVFGGKYATCNVKLGEYFFGGEKGVFLNEAVIWGLPGKIVEYELHVDEMFLYKARSDGVIVATAAGSTGHVLSYGSPIVLNWCLPIITIFPVGPLSPLIKPIIVFEKTLEIKIGKWTAQLVVDGQRKYVLESGTAIKLGPSSREISLIRTKSNSCIPSTEKIRNRLLDRGLSFIP